MISEPTRRVVITGLGLIGPLGNTPAALWSALQEGRSGVERLECVPSQFLPTSIAAEARGFTGEIDDFGPLEKEQKKAIRKGLKIMSRESQMGVASSQLAIVDAQLVLGKYDPERSGVIFGVDYMLTLPEEFSSGVNRCRSAENTFDFSRWGAEGMPQLTPLWLLKYLPNMPASHVAIYNDLRGPNNSLTLREAAANLAIGESFRTIVRGSAETMIAGATGTRVHPMKLVHAVQQEEVAGNGAEPHTASRPFDRDRTGMVLGEGAGSIVLEELNTAQARGAKIYGEVIGFSSSQVTDRNFVAHRDTALINVMQGALRDAGLEPDAIGHIHAHGLSTRSSDVEEARAIQAVFGNRATPVPVTAAKSYFGNLGAGSGMIELIASLLAFEHDELFPILNFKTPDPEAPVAAVVDRGQKPGDSVLSVSVTPQGQASAVIVRRFAG